MYVYIIYIYTHTYIYTDIPCTMFLLMIRSIPIDHPTDGAQVAFCRCNPLTDRWGGLLMSMVNGGVV